MNEVLQLMRAPFGIDQDNVMSGCELLYLILSLVSAIMVS
jgi:hypothetical protein